MYGEKLFMNEKALSNPLASEPVSKLMVKFAVPSIIAMLVGALYNIVDQLFIGQAVGMLGNAATNIAFPFSTSCVALGLLFGIGGASCFNLSMGRGEREAAPYFIGNAAVMLASCGVVLTAVTLLLLRRLLILFGSPEDVLEYAIQYVRVTALGFPFLILTTGGGHLIRADGSPRMTMICSLTGAVINTVLDAIFVFVFNWGMVGAASATVIGQAVSAIIVIVYLTHYKTVKLEVKHFIIRFKYVAKTASIGMASFFNQLAMMLVQIVMNNSLRYYGELSQFGSAIPIACSGIITKVNQVVLSVVIGLGQGTQPIESFNYGARNYTRVRQAYRVAITAGSVISVLAFLVFQLFPKQLLMLFGSGSEEYFEFGVRFFRIYLFFTWINCLQPITSTFFTSIGKPIKGMFLSLTRQIIFFIPLLLVLPLFIGIDGVVYTAPIADFLAAAVTVFMVTWEFRIMKREEACGK